MKRKTTLKALCEAAKKRDGWYINDGGQIRNVHCECPIVAGYIVLTGKKKYGSDDKREIWNSDAPNLARKLGLTVDPEIVMEAADAFNLLTPHEKRIRTLMMKYLNVEEAA